MENIVEKSVVKPRQKKDIAIICVTVILCFIGSAIPLFVPTIIAFLPVFLLLFGFVAYKVITSRNVEFEYEMVENYMTISKIINKRSRKKIFNSTITDFDILAPRKSRYYQEIGLNVQRTIEAVSDLELDNIYFGVIQFNDRKTCVFFETDERVLKHLKKYGDYKFKS